MAIKYLDYDGLEKMVEEIDAKYAKLSDLPSSATSINGLSGGSLTSPLVIKGGDATTAPKIAIDQTQSGQITNNSTQTLFGFTSNNTSNLTIGHTSYAMLLRGSATRPTYNGNSMALSSDIPTALSQLTQSASYRTVTDTEKSTWNNKNNATSYNLVNDSGQASTSGYVRKRIANINGQYLTFHKQYSTSASTSFSGGAFTNVLLAWVEQASTSDTQSQRTTLKSVSTSSWSIAGGYKHWICVIGFTN